MPINKASPSACKRPPAASAPRPAVDHARADHGADEGHRRHRQDGETAFERVGESVLTVSAKTNMKALKPT